MKDEKKTNLSASLSDLRRYSFCKSHAISYGKLFWALAYCNAQFPKEFWTATLNHANSGYRKWVHYRSAINSGLEIYCFQSVSNYENYL
jgi:DNA polymerase III alpha subunit